MTVTAASERTTTTSGEHEVVDVRDDGTTDPSRAQWLPLFSQRTKPRVEEKAENEDAKIEDKNDDAP